MPDGRALRLHKVESVGYMHHFRALRAHCAVAACGAAYLLATVPTVAVGQSAASAPSTGNPPGSQLEEIVVTAEKRNANIQDTPISVTAVSGADLQAQGLTDLGSAAREIPGVAQTSAGPGQTEYTIRGLSSPGAAVATTGFYVDDVPMTAPSGAQNGHVVIDPDLYDLNRVEVLRGPQGTLYGSGSMGGTIKLVTNQPDTHEFAASAQVDGSGTQGGGFNHRVNAMINIPLISDQLAVRVVATDDYTSGWIDRIVLGNFPLPTNPQPQCAPFAGCTRGNLVGTTVLNDHHDVNDEDLKGVRGSVRYQPTDQLTLTAMAFYQTLGQDGLSYYDNPPGTEAHYQPFDVPEPFSDTFRMYNVVGQLAMSPFTITSATSYWTRSQSQTQDVSETAQTALDLPAYAVDQGGVGAVGITEIDYTQQLSQEVRLTSSGDSALQWLVGGFYSDYTYKQNQDSLAAGFVPFFGTENLITLYQYNHLKQTAAFGEISYKITGSLKATIGARYYSYKQEGAETLSGIVEASLTPTTTDVAADNSGINPKFTLSYDIVPDLMVYGTAAKGFRPGAGDAPVPITGADSCLADLEALGKTQAPTQYNPDTVWNYELGEKATLLDQRLTVNSAIYYESWNKVQQSVALACGFNYIDNVGAADVRGGELEVNYKPAPEWEIDQTGGYTHAVLTSTEPGTGLTVGNRLLNVPTYSVSTSLLFTHPIAQLNLIARASNVHVGSQQVQSYFLETLPGYDIANARVGLTTAHWAGYLYVNNITDEHAELSVAHNYALDIPSLDRVATNQPRTTGISFEYRY
jgi:iron complex outermembrane recepter protein